MLCYLTDEDLVRFLVNSREHLLSKEKSIVVVKENVGDNLYDESDKSVARTRRAFE